MKQVISNPPINSTQTDILSEKFTSSQNEHVTFTWIQNLPQELKDVALLRFCKTVEAKPTLVESFALNQVIYRTISGGTFTESAENTASRTGCDRKTILKGLNQAVEQNILNKNDRPGTSTEYSFKPVEEWLPEPVVRFTDYRTRKVIEFPRIQNTEGIGNELQLASSDGVVRDTDYHETDDHQTDTNNNDLIEEFARANSSSGQEDVSVRVEDTQQQSRWKYVGQGLPRVYVPPELDSDTGLKIEEIHQATKEPRQLIIKEAVEMLHQSISLPKPEPILMQRVPEDVLCQLSENGIDIEYTTAERLYNKYSERFESAITYTIAQDKMGKVHNKSGFFRTALEQGWKLLLNQDASNRNTEFVPNSINTQFQEEDNSNAVVPEELEKWSTSAITTRMQLRPGRLARLKALRILGNSSESPDFNFLLECWEDPALRIVIKSLIQEFPDWKVVCIGEKLVHLGRNN